MKVQKSNLQELAKMSKAQVLDTLKKKNVKGGKGCPPPGRPPRW